MRAIAGANWQANLSKVPNLLVDEDMERALIDHPFVVDSRDAVHLAVGMAQGAVAECLLNSFPSDKSPSSACLARAVERRQDDFVERALKQGVDLAANDPTTGRNAFHAAAIYNTLMVPRLIDELAKVSNSHLVKEALQATN